MSYLRINAAVYAQKRFCQCQVTDRIVKDSVHNYVLRSATVSVYKDDAKLIGYQLTNNFGKFQFKTLPVNTKLSLLMSYVGYKTYKKILSSRPILKKLDLKTLISRAGGKQPGRNQDL